MHMLLKQIKSSLDDKKAGSHAILAYAWVSKCNLLRIKTRCKIIMALKINISCNSNYYSLWFLYEILKNVCDICSY